MEDEWNTDGGLVSLTLEVPSAIQLPGSIRFRSFTETSYEDNESGDSATITAWKATRWNDLGIHKRRRLDDAPGYECGDVVQPLLHVVKDSFDVAQRRMETLHWFQKPRSAEEISARFALDRRLGVTPSLAATHQALTRLQQLNRTEAIIDLTEDLVMDSPTISLWTLLRIVDGLKGQPQCAARIVFSLSPLVTNGAVPPSAWTSLCDGLDKVARQLPAPLERPLVELFGEVLYRARDDGPVDGKFVVYYGQALLKSRAPIGSIMGFVRAELLSGRNAPSADGTSAIRLGAFLSDLIQVMCSASGGAEEREERVPISAADRLMHCGDLVKHAYAGRLQLTQGAFDAFLRFCDESQDYHRLCIVFLAMCTLSTPTLSSVARVAEVLCDVKQMSDYLADVLHQSTPSLMLYLLLRHGSVSLFPQINNNNIRTRGGNVSNNERDKLEMHFCTCLARLCVRDGDEFVCMALFSAIIDIGRPVGASAFISEVANSLRCPVKLFGGRATPAGVAASVEPFNVEALYYALRPAVASSGSGGIGDGTSLDALRTILQSRPLASLLGGRDLAEKTCGTTVEQALAGLLTSPHVYCTVVCESAISSLVKSPPLAEAFAKMMDGYATKMGAIAFVPFDVCTAEQLTDDGRKFLFEWISRYAWFVVLPLSLTMQLAMNPAAVTVGKWKTEERLNESRCIRLFHAIQATKHTKVAFITAEPNVAEDAKASGVHPVITLTDLAKRLGIN